MYAGSVESFGKQWVPGDVVGVFLDLVDHTISKTVKNTMQINKKKIRLILTLAIENCKPMSNHLRNQSKVNYLQDHNNIL